MQRVIALDGVPAMPREKAKTGGTDLSRTVHEWCIEPSFPAGEPPAHNLEASAEPHWATHSSISLEPLEELQLPARILNANIEDAVTHQYDPAITAKPLPLAASTSGSDLASLDRALQTARIPAAHELGAVTNIRQERTTAEPIAAESQPPTQPALTQPQPRMLLVPASMVWAVLTVLSLCTLALTFLVVALILHR